MHSLNLELHIVDHCNLRCVACSHDSPELRHRTESCDVLETALRRLWAHYQAPLIKLLGGEPLLHPAIADIISITKSVCDARVRLVTNGLLLNSRKDELRDVDEIHISQYPGVREPDIDTLRDISSDLCVPVTVQRFEHFRWHKAASPLATQTTARVFNTCQMFHDWQCHTLRDGRFYPCPAAATWAAVNSDCVDLMNDSVDIAEALCALLSRSAPLRSCAQCLGSAGRLVRHAVDRRKIDAALIPPAEIDRRFLARLERVPDAWNECYEYAYTVLPSGTVLLGNMQSA